MDIQYVGVVGAGVMGSSLAQALALTGHNVFLVDISNDILEGVKSSFVNSIRLQMMFNKDLRQEDPATVLNRVTFSVDLRLLADADFVIENVTEKWDVKKEVFKRLDEICQEHCILASNTSAIPIKKIAAATKRREKVIGLHFMNPVTLKSTVEMIPGEDTSEETVAISKKLLTQMKKDWIIVNDSPGFVSNRVLMLTINEAICLLEEKVASAEDIDRIFKSCFSYKMGPLETADLIGLDTILLSLEVLFEHLNDSKYKPCALLKKMVDNKCYGRKNGSGFYEYSQ